MKKLVGVLLGAALIVGTWGISYAQEKQDPAKQDGKGKGKDDKGSGKGDKERTTKENATE